MIAQVETPPSQRIDPQLAPTDESQPAPQSSARLVFVDTLRVALTILVVMHHLAVTYGASAPWYYIEAPQDDGLTFIVLLIFILFNQAWFMGCFFLIAGYFTPASYDRKGAGAFLKDRLLRL
ncbi:MAG: acyltransferase family protein, partial [Chloroflexi bacterium]|nr:acyltransferase family protein [Chloroflexota bacterium]